jgi:hypothetical protein
VPIVLNHLNDRGISVQEKRRLEVRPLARAIAQPFNMSENAIQAKKKCGLEMETWKPARCVPATTQPQKTFARMGIF